MKTRTIEEEELLPKCNEHLSYSSLQNIEVTPSRNGNQAGLGCILSDVGTTADIYLAHSADKHFRKRTVAKVFRNDSGHELLRKELIVMRECAGPHLLRAMDADFDKGILYMEQAIPLSELLASHYYKLTVKEFCNLLIDIASGLKELLEHGIFYRDIHLNNIFFSDTVIDGRNIYKLGDFGSCTFADKNGRFAGLTERGGVGSKWYMAPETWKHGVFDERSAVYGVGMIAYHLLNDLYPPLWLEYGEESLELRIQSHRLPIPTKLQEERFGQLRMDFLFKSLRNNPSERYQTIDKLIGAISECADSKYSNQVLVEGTEFKTAAKIAQDETFCSTCAGNPSIVVSNGEVGTTSKTDVLSTCKSKTAHVTYCPRIISESVSSSLAESIQGSIIGGVLGALLPVARAWCGQNAGSMATRLLHKKVYASIFAPSEVKKGGHLLVQVYLHLPEETEKVKALASEADKSAERRGYEPLEVPLKKGDNVEIELNINGDSLLYNCRKSVVWQGSFVKRAFDFAVPSDINVSELSCSVNVFVNGAIAGEMIFITNIVDTPRALNTNVIAKPTKKLFISYSHKDIKEAEKIAKIQEALGTDVFFDKHRLKAGYIFSEEISRFIQTADTFVLCWSENAANSDYVEKERQEALALAYPQRKPREQAILSILPFNIEPHAVPPADMIEHYHFAEL